MEREVRYCTTEDGVRIAYCVEGDGPPLLAIPFFIESFSLDHIFPEYRRFLQRIAAGRQLIRFDSRGVGLSQRDVEDLSPEALISDGVAVMDACGLDRVSAWASLTSGPYVIRFALRSPTRFEDLILYGTCGAIGKAYPTGTVEMFAMLASANWELACRTLADLTGRLGFADATLRLADWFRQSTTPENGANAMRGAATQDLTGQLGDLAVRTLVLHRIDDPAIRFGLGQEMAAAIPGSLFVPLQGNANFPTFGDEDPIVDAVRSFLGQESASSTNNTIAPEAASPFRTVFFTDLVGHTEMMSRLGDDRGRAVLREHEAITRQVLKQHGGTEVKTMGDGFLASFGSVTKAVECAVALQRAFAEREGEPLSIRVGLNAGEPIEEDGDLFGATVILASRIAAKADGGEILVADTVRGLCSGKGFLFADRGEFVAKGFEEPVRVYEVRWRA
jgi:pimeloyl-ACP methyl ester carboxylesterase